MDKAAPAESEAWHQEEAAQILMRINRARAAAKLSPLEWDRALAAAALEHGLQRTAGQPPAHRFAGELDLPARAAQTGARFNLIEESDAVAPTLDGIVRLWMRSEQNRAALLNPDMGRAGIAVVGSGDGGNYAVADIGRSGPELTREQVEDRIARALHAKDRALSIHDVHDDARLYCAQTSKAEIGHLPHYQFSWEGSDLTNLPPELLKKLASHQFNEAEVGSCPIHDTDEPFVSYRVGVLLFYDTSNLPQFINPESN